MLALAICICVASFISFLLHLIVAILADGFLFGEFILYFLDLPTEEDIFLLGLL
jgi:hypothetical protein